VADSVVLARALALDDCVEAGVVVNNGAIHVNTGARVTTDVPCYCRRLAKNGEHRVHRRSCKLENRFTFTTEIDRS
jgi:hypothetical protein